jgi:hypothetical protein
MPKVDHALKETIQRLVPDLTTLGFYLRANKHLLQDRRSTGNIRKPVPFPFLSDNSD